MPKKSANKQVVPMSFDESWEKIVAEQVWLDFMSDNGADKLEYEEKIAKSRGEKTSTQRRLAKCLDAKTRADGIWLHFMFAN